MDGGNERIPTDYCPYSIPPVAYLRSRMGRPADTLSGPANPPRRRNNRFKEVGSQ